MSKFDEALERMRGWLESPLSKIEGTFSMFNIRSVAMESAYLQNLMDIIRDNYFLDTASGVYLDRKALDDGLTRQYAQPSVGEVTFSGTVGVVVPMGTLVAASAYGVRFVTLAAATIGDDGTATVRARCESMGVAGNVPAGAIDKLSEAIQGIVGVTNAAAFEDGADRESDTQFRGRLYNKIRYPATSGNVQCYINWAMDLQGVGAVKVFPLWNGPGTVKVSILDANKGVASAELIADVKAAIDPGGGTGEGLAPVGADVSITTATEKVVDVAATVLLGTTAGTVDEVSAAFKAVLEAYFADIAYDKKTVAVSPAQVGYRLFDVAGVVDYASLTLNGATDAVTIGDEEILTLGTVTLTKGGA